MKHLFLYILFIVISLGAYSQDKLLFLNGKEINGKILEKTKYEFKFQSLEKKSKTFTIDKYRLFSYTEGNQPETILYNYDTLTGNFLKVEDMKLFVYGERDAQKGYKSSVTNIIGLGMGGASGYFMHKDQNFLFVTTPLLYTVINIVPSVRVNKKHVTDVKYLEENEYLLGYERIAKGKKIQGALKSSIIGLGVGFAVSAIVNGSSK